MAMRPVVAIRPVAAVRSVVAVRPVTLDLVEQVEGQRRVIQIGTKIRVMATRAVVPARVHRPWRQRLKPGAGHRAAARAPGLGLPAVDGELAFELAAILARRIAVGERRRDMAVVTGGRVLPGLGLAGPVELERVLKRLFLMTPVGIGQQRIG